MGLSVGSLFAGIGGFDLAARNVGWHTTWYSEIDPYACRVMQKHFPEAINLGDITALSHPPYVDVLCGGFPCQDISHAGKGAGIAEGTRSGLWIHYARIIKEISPRYVVIENVARLRTLGLGRVLRDLDALGYVGEWHCIPASAVGAPHVRDRVWIVAHTDRAQCEGSGIPGRVLSGFPDARGRGVDGDASEDVAHASRVGQPRQGSPRDARDQAAERDGQATHVVNGGVGHFWRVEPDVGRVAHGVPARMDRLRCLGNAIVPQVAEVLFHAINDHRSMVNLW